jgi:hypothetical protein
MNRVWIAATLAALAAGCLEPPKTNRALVYVQGLQDLTRWDPVNGGKGHDAYEAILGLPPNDCVPVLIATLLDPTPTKINDPLHRPPTVGDVCFHMLLLLFGMKPADFEVEGVWVSKRDPSRNPIYTVRLENDTVREKVRERFAKLAIDRGWYGDAEPKERR